MATIDPDLTDFSGVLSARRGNDVLGEWAVGLADRTAQSPNTPATRFALASGSKTFTALTVLSLVDQGILSLDTPARAFLRDDLPLIGDDVTIDHLLTHRSGIGDYLDEDVDELAPLSIPVQQLENPQDYLPMLGGLPAKFSPGEQFSYCNGGYMVLALIAERAAGTPFARLVAQRVFEPAGMESSGFFRSDRLPPGTATGYKDDGRSNIYDLPVVGSGDGGAYSTVSDLHAFWRILPTGSVIPGELLEVATQPVTRFDDGGGYGRGFWLDDGDVRLSGFDHGATALSRHDYRTGITVTALANMETPVRARTQSLMEAARS